MISLKYLGHSAFLLTAPSGHVLFDPFLTSNPKAAALPEEVPADVILVTHAHGDHLGDAVAIAKRTGALIVATFELANYCAARGASVRDPHFGGTVRLPAGRVKLFPAVHSSSTDEGENLGQAASFVLETGGRRFFHAGDTALFSDLALIAEESSLDVAMLPIGGHYTMDVDDAVRAVRMLRPRTVVPMHYGTFPLIEADPLEFKAKVESSTSSRCAILRPGEELTLEEQRTK